MTRGLSNERAIENLIARYSFLVDDGTPRTRHITTNLPIEIDEAAGSARVQSYYTVLQSLPDFPLQPIATGTYHERFERRDAVWRFTARSVQTRFAGDTSRHRRPMPPEAA